MLVRVNESYGGCFGLPDREVGNIRMKRAGDPPFELDDPLAAAHIESGVLVPESGSAQEHTEWSQLKARAKALGINPVGKSKAALEQMVREHGAAPAEAEEPLMLETPDPVTEG